MVDLPKVSRELRLTRAPDSMVSGADIARPFTEFAQGMESLGGALTGAATIVAQEEGKRAVTMDANGNPTVQTMPPFTGRAAQAHNQAALTEFTVQQDMAIRKKAQEAQQQFEYDPVGFNEHWTNYTEGLVGNQTSPEAARIARTNAAKYGDQVSRSITVRAHGRDVQRQNAAVDARLVTYADDIERLVRDGAPQEAVDAQLGEFNALLDQKVNNPALAYPRELADRFKDDVLTRAYGAQVINQTEEVYRTKGFDAARSYVRDAARGLGGTIKQADKIERQGMAWLAGEERGLKGERDQISKEWTEARKNLATLPRDALDDLEERARAVGSPVAFDIQTRRSSLAIQTELRRLPQDEQARIATTGIIPANVLQRIRGNESRGDPNARPVDPKSGKLLSSAVGTFQFTSGTWLDTVRTYRPDLFQGRTQQQVLDLRRDPAVSDELGERFTEQNARGLSNAGIPVTGGSLYGAHFLGLGDAVKVYHAAPGTPVSAVVSPQSIAANKSIFDKYQTTDQLIGWLDRKMAGGVAGPATERPQSVAPQQIDLTSSRTGLIALNAVKADLRRDLTRNIEEFASATRRLELPALSEVMPLASTVAAVGTPEQQQKVAELIVQAQQGEEFSRMSAPDREAAVSAMRAQISEGAPAAERDLVNKLAQADDTITKAYRDNPYEAHARFGVGVQPLPPLDFNDPARSGAILAGKVQQQSVIRAGENLPAFSALQPAEARAFQNFMATANGDQVVTAIGQIASLPDEILYQTLKDDTVKGALLGAMRSTDPAKFNAVMGSMETLYQRQPNDFTKLLGDDAMHTLIAWQSSLRYKDPETLTDSLKRAQDPTTIKQREQVQTEALQSLGKFGGSSALTRGELLEKEVAAMDQRGFFGRMIEGAATAPMDQFARDSLMADFASQYAIQYGKTLNHDESVKGAVKALTTKWSRSEANGGKLMLRAPETLYPPINGDAGWISDQAEMQLMQRFGPRTVTGDPGKQNWSYEMVPDRQTEIEASRYDRTKPVGPGNVAPSYNVIVTDNRVTPPKTSTGRMSFDPARPMSEDERRWSEDRSIRRSIAPFGMMPGRALTIPGPRQ